MIWQNETIYKTSNSSKEVILRFTGGRNPKWLNVIYTRLGKKSDLYFRFDLSHSAKTRNSLIRQAAEKMCDHLGISSAEINSVACDIRKFISQVL